MTASDPQLPEWNLYRNVKYGFEFKYPKNLLVYSDEQPAPDPDEGSAISVSQSKAEQGRIPQRISITIHDHISTEDSYSLYQIPATLWTGDLQQLVLTLWRLAKADGTAAGPVISTSVGGRQAYSFTVNGAVGVNDLGYSVDTENKWIFVKQGGWVFEIACPNNAPFMQVLQTFRFDSSDS
jgi:hypothetical protein